MGDGAVSSAPRPMREKVIDTARELGLDVEVRRLDESTATVEDAAEAVGCDAARIAKSIVFIADGDPVLCVAAATHRIEPDLLADVLDVAEVRQATPDEVRAATGYSSGACRRSGTTCLRSSTRRC